MTVAYFALISPSVLTMFNIIIDAVSVYCINCLTIHQMVWTKRAARNVPTENGPRQKEAMTASLLCQPNP